MASVMVVRSCDRLLFVLYLQAADSGLVEFAQRTRVTVRSAANTMSAAEPSDGRMLSDTAILCRRVAQAGNECPAKGPFL